MKPTRNAEKEDTKLQCNEKKKILSFYESLITDL